MNASEGLKSTAALAPSSPMPLPLRSIVVRLLLCFNASARALGRDKIPRQNKSHLFLTPLPSKLNLSEPRPQHCHQSRLQARYACLPRSSAKLQPVKLELGDGRKSADLRDLPGGCNLDLGVLLCPATEDFDFAEARRSRRRPRPGPSPPLCR